MDHPINQFKAALAERRRQIGMWSALASPVAAEILAHAGFDWVLIDMEHAPNDLPQVLAQAQTLAAGPAPVLCRPAWNDMVLIKRILDIGIQSLIIPFVQTAQEARAAVAATRYPPGGVRGVAGGSRASHYGRVPGYQQNAASEIAVVVQIETREAVDRIEEIAAVDGIDALFVGPADLAASMGHLGDLQHPDVQAAIAEAAERCHAAGKPIGTLAIDKPVADRYFEMGYDFIAVAVDSVLLARTADALAKSFR
ncbi:MAG: HpcH/HpaI aldolase/citrate lyase family protein [Pseudomonadota bacterium]